MQDVYNLSTEFIEENLSRGLHDKPAFIDLEVTLTYGDLQSQSNKVANMLCDMGVAREARIAILMLDTVNWPVVFFGAVRAGIVPVAFNTLLVSEQYQYMLEDSRAQVLFVSAPLLDVVKPILPKLTFLKKIIVVGESKTSELPIRHEDFTTLMASAKDTFDIVDTVRDETAFWLYSSGSTGAPKGTRHVHSSMSFTAQTYGKNVLGVRQDDICFSAAKFFFAYGLGNAISFPLSVGATTILLPSRPTPQDVFALLKKHRVSLYFGVPTLYAAMLADETCTAQGLENLRLCVSAGEALPKDVGESWKKKFQVDIIDGIGSTEMLHIFLSNAPGAIRYGTSGQAFEGYELKLLDDDGKELGTDEIGELIVKGESAAEGYWNQREKSRKTFAGEWTHTGDKYTRDEDGYYHYCGRTDDMFKVSGIWVSPFEVESALISHEAVLEAAVVPQMDAGELIKPKAFVILKDVSRGAELKQELQQHVKDKAGKWKYPRWIEFVDTLPKTATGKIQRFKLRG